MDPSQPNQDNANQTPPPQPLPGSTPQPTQIPVQSTPQSFTAPQPSDTVPNPQFPQQPINIQPPTTPSNSFPASSPQTFASNPYSSSEVPSTVQSSKKLWVIVGSILVLALAGTVAFYFMNNKDGSFSNNSEDTNQSVTPDKTAEATAALGLTTQDLGTYQLLVPSSYEKNALGSTVTTFTDRNITEPAKQPTFSIISPEKEYLYASGAKSLDERKLLAEKLLDFMVNAQVAQDMLKNGQKSEYEHPQGPAFSYTADLVAQGVSYGKSHMLAVASEKGVYLIGIQPRDSKDLANAVDVIRQSFSIK